VSKEKDQKKKEMWKLNGRRIKECVEEKLGVNRGVRSEVRKRPTIQYHWNKRKKLETNSAPMP